MRENNPDLLLSLEEEGNVTEYLSGKVSTLDALLDQAGEQPGYTIEEACMDILTQDLRPSKFNYISAILEEEFEATYHQLKNSGTLKFEVINLINECQLVFDAIPFIEENENNRQLQYAVIGTISKYLESNK